MRIEYFCFVAAALAALTGMGLGLYMGLAHDFKLAPAHAHLNLLGWVTMCLYGLYHRGRKRAATALSWLQVGAGTAGFASMSGGIAGLMTIGGPVMLTVALSGASLAIVSMLLFLVMVIGDGRPRRNAETRAALGGEAAVFAGEGNFVHR
jgi:hypothetical protein